MELEKNAVREYWNEAPCGTRDLTESDEARRFRELEQRRYQLEPCIEQFARFEERRGAKLLEVGVGAGSDHIRFARAGAVCAGVDLSEVSLATTKRRFELEGLTSDLRHSDAEHLPFEDATFDFVYSWGVIHHTPDTNAAAREILRVLRPGGRFAVMVYNRQSLLAAQAWLKFAALKGRPFTSISKVLADNVESPGTKAYSAGEAAGLFSRARDVDVETVVTVWDMRVGRRRFLPNWTHALVPNGLGWFHIVTGEK